MVVKSFLALTIRLKIVNDQMDCHTNNLIKIYIEIENRIRRKGQECIKCLISLNSEILCKFMRCTKYHVII